MENVVAFPARKPVQVETRAVSLEQMFEVLSGRKTLEDLRREALHEARLTALRVYGVADLRRFWDEIGDNSFYEGPEGMFDCSDIHRVLNEKGDGYYCAV